jgi:hypothetical protein
MDTNSESVVVVVKESACREPPFEMNEKGSQREFAALSDVETWVEELNQETAGTFYLQTANPADKEKGIDKYLMFRNIVTL